MFHTLHLGKLDTAGRTWTANCGYMKRVGGDGLALSLDHIVVADLVTFRLYSSFPDVQCQSCAMLLFSEGETGCDG